MTQFIKITSFVQFFKNLHVNRTIHNMQYIYRGKSIVYALKCEVTNMIYIGSTFVPGRRFHNHLITGTRSNDALQKAITQYGLNNFTVYVLEVVEFPNRNSEKDKINTLRMMEQKHMDKFPKQQLYNSIASSRNKL